MFSVSPLAFLSFTTTCLHLELLSLHLCWYSLGLPDHFTGIFNQSQNSQPECLSILLIPNLSPFGNSDSYLWQYFTLSFRTLLLFHIFPLFGSQCLCTETHSPDSSLLCTFSLMVSSHLFNPGPYFNLGYSVVYSQKFYLLI